MKKKFLSCLIFIICIATSYWIICHKNSRQAEIAPWLFQENKATDPVVHLLGLAGIRIEGDALGPDPSWPSPKLMLSSRSLDEITDAIQGKIDPAITWLIQGERWQTQGLSYLTFTKDEAAAILKLFFDDLKFGQTERPKARTYAGVLFLGSTLESVRQRLLFLNTLLDENRFAFSKVYLLTGVRPLDPSVGETSENLADPKGLIAVRSDWSMPNDSLPTDESEMVQWVFSQSRSEAIRKDQLELIYAGVGEGRNRATTKTTVEEWLKINPKDGVYLAISSQPYNLYQKLVIERALHEGRRADIHLEVVGQGMASPTASLDLNKEVAKALDTLARTCYELKQRSR